MSRFVNFELDKRVADKAGELVYKSRQANNPILMPDAIIAATSVVHSLTLITFNAQDFKIVAGLKLHPLSKVKRFNLIDRPNSICYSCCFKKQVSKISSMPTLRLSGRGRLP